MRHSIVYLAAAFFLLGNALSARGDDYHWIAPGGGSFGDPANWSGPAYDVPGSDDEAYFDLWGSYPVTFSSDVANEMLVVFDDMVDFDLGEHSYTLSGPGGDAVQVITSLSGGLTIANGDVLANSRIVVDSVGGSASINIMSDGRLRAQYAQDLFIGDVGTGSVWSEGTLDVTGDTYITAGSLLTLDGGSFSTRTIDVGGDSSRVSWNGGSFTLTASDLNIGLSGPLGSIVTLSSPGMPLSVSGTTTVELDSALVLDGGRLSTGALDYGEDPLRFAWLDGTLNLTNSDLLIGTGGLLDPVGIETIGPGMQLGVSGTVTVAVDGWLFVDGGAMTVGPSTSHGGANTLRLERGGAMIIEGQALVGTETGPIEIGSLRLEADGIVDFRGGLLVADKVDVIPGGTIAVTEPDPGFSDKSTLRVNSLEGLGPGLIMPEFLNLQLGHSGGSATVHLSSAPLSVSGDEVTLTVGYDSEATVTIDSGSTASTPRLYIGDQPTGDGTVNLDGPGTTWTVSEALVLGPGHSGFNSGGQSELNITGGAHMISFGGRVGLEADSQATVTVRGADSTWTTDTGWVTDIPGWLYVASRGTGTINIEEGGQVTSWATFIGADPLWGDLTGAGTVTVDGDHSKLTSRVIYIGVLGEGHLNVRNEGTVDADLGSTTALGVGERGTVTVESGGVLLTSSGALKNDDYAGSGQDPVVTVRGSGSTWTNNGPLDIAYRDGPEPTSTTGGEVIIESGGTVSSGRVSVGLTPFASGSISVTGDDATLDVTEALAVGGDAYPHPAEPFGGTGRLDVAGGGRVSFTTALYFPAGVLIGLRDMASGTVTVDGSTSTLESDSPIWVGALGGTGRMEITSGGTVTNPGATIGYSTGLMGASQGSVLVDDALWDNGGEIVEVGDGMGSGTLELAHGGQVTAANVRVWGGSRLEGNGQVNGNVINGGSVAPGGSVGILSVEGGFYADPAGTLEIELAGHGGTPGADFDQLTTSGVADLDGTLDVSLIAALHPEFGDRFQIVTAAGGVTGTFATTASGLPALPGLGWQILYGANDVTLAVGIVGDYNLNGCVDAADYTVWRDTLGSETDLRADGDGNGKIEEADYGVWKSHFGNVAGSGSLQSTAVPEPASLVLLVGLAVGAMLWRRGRAA